jgi:hypothetical protein
MKKLVNVEGLSTNALLRVFASLKTELRLRKFRNPIEDRAVQLIEEFLEGQKMRPSNKGFDLLLADGQRVEVKARCIIEYTGSRILASDIRCLKKKQFDVLAMIIFHCDLTVARALLIPYQVVAERAQYSRHSNAWRFYIREDLLTLPGVRDITKELNALEAEGACDAMQYRFVLTA